MRYRGEDLDAELTVAGVQATVDFLVSKHMSHCAQCSKVTPEIGAFLIEPITNEFILDWDVKMLCDACLSELATNYPTKGPMQ